MAKKLKPVHVGEHLREEFLRPLRIGAGDLAKALYVSPSRIRAIVSERRGIDGDMALRLGRYFGTGPEFWMNLQSRYEMESAKDAKLAEITKQIKPRKNKA